MPISVGIFMIFVAVLTELRGVKFTTYLLLSSIIQNVYILTQEYCSADKGKDNEKAWSMGRPSHTSQVRYYSKHAIIEYIDIDIDIDIAVQIGYHQTNF